MSDLASIINEAWEKRNDITPADAGSEYGKAVEEAIALLDSGKERVAEPKGCLLYTSPSPRDQRGSRMPSSA